MKRFLFVFACFSLQLNICAKPKITVVIIIDQFAAHYIPKLDPYLNQGINHLLREGISYTNTYLPYATTSTAVGHASIGTGALPKDHGIIYNKWIDPQGDKASPEDHNGKNIMVPTLNKPFLAEDPKNKALAISLKARAAFGLAGKDTNAIWFNEDTAEFETNANDPIIQQIVQTWNKKIKTLDLSWNQYYNDKHYYQFPHIKNYQFASEPQIINTTSTLQTPSAFAARFVKLPLANQVLLDMTAAYIKKEHQKEPQGNILAWVSLSSLDKIGHAYGPDSQEIIDMIYQLDHQIKTFMNQIDKLEPQETLYVLTADHGVMPIPELHKNKFPTTRLYEDDIIEKVNKAVMNKLGYKNALEMVKVPHVVCNKKLMQKLSPNEKRTLFALIKKELKNYSDIKNVYTEEELLKMNPEVETVPWLLKNNIYPTRSGDLLIETEPYALICKYKTGAKHNNPYPYNTHVPLILYQRDILERKVFPQKVWLPQITATLANILEIATPSSVAMPALTL